MEEFFNDQPITESNQDKFLRNSFAERIASLISAPRIGKSFVLGVYGKWGEGKSSVLNLIEEHLPDETVLVKFNPWYFSDQEQLLRSFLLEIKHGLAQTNHTKEQIGKLLENYSASLGVAMQLVSMAVAAQMGSFREVNPEAAATFFNELGKRIQHDPIEKAKQKIDDAIIKTGRNVVVFIDDIDRLDAREAYFILKLVKLIADFPRTCYVLAFDQDIVADAIASYFGTDKLAGARFLEKVVQLNVTLPKATRKQIRKFLNEKMQSVVKQHGLEIETADLSNFSKKFDEVFVSFLTTPRLVVKYCNNVSLALPLMKDEVNIVDLLLLEATKILMPNLYTFIREHGAHIIAGSSPISRVESDYINGGRETIEQRLKNELNRYSGIEKDRVSEILVFLFPQIDKILNNRSYSDEMAHNWIRSKRICSFYHYDKYFTYVVQNDEIPDALLTGIFDSLDNSSSNDIVSFITNEIDDINLDELIHRLRYWERHLSEAQSEKLIDVLIQLSPLLNSNNAEFMSASTLTNCAYCISFLINNISTDKKAFNTAKSTLNKVSNIDFTLELEYSIASIQSKMRSGIRFSLNQTNELKQLIFKRHIENSGSEIFVNIPHHQLVRLLLWAAEFNEAALSKFLRPLVTKKKQDAVAFIKVFVPTITSTSERFKANFGKVQYSYIAKTYSVDELFDVLSSSGSRKTHDPYLQFANYQALSDKDIVDLFINYYLESKKA